MSEASFKVPGDELGVIEEFFPARNAYEQDGVVRAKVVGWARLDLLKHEASVSEARKARLPRSGDVVHAVVSGVRDAVANVEIVYNETRGAFYPIPFRGIVHISEASNERLKSLNEVYGYGDVIRAKVLSQKPPYQLSTKGADFGVIMTRCPKCTTPLRKRGLWLYCPICKKTYKKKKISKHYSLK